MDIYAENILDHFRSPRHAGILADATVVHEEKNLSCGDELKLSLLLENGKVMQIGWEGTGCAISQSSMSILSEELIGKNEEDVLALTKNDVYKLLGVPIGPRRFKCALMSLHTMKNAILKARGENVQSWTETVTEE
ncbi:MAG TPA: iron-sulfur cluster assembly scaffold protein [Candidatus Peribacterales bacterium]|nr:iron-sulfur cluster assembly scaffold protein [Candidatus Peribacterales bacterium]